MASPQDLEALRASLRTCVDALHRRRASDIPEPLIERLVSQRWLEWRGGALCLTSDGESIYWQELA
ncbi:hypothetical protein [Mitsuaria sp. 7]|uniref:hypothetical protein n=1 Tax=Mitsuaria sp. 7 TaxID=1658665 RepID=UPI0007DCD728|nr:hypothetical protein [Mitsuaria sp. 7]ANH68464.1 hypothetical protein ABE85_14415 [Mitsuaria sp. 7]